MTSENNTYRVEPAARLRSVSEYYFSRKLKEVARMNAEGKDVISLGVGSPDMPPSGQTIDTLCREARDSRNHGYVPTIGTAELREAMSRWYERRYGVSLNPQDEILPLIGSKEGILHITMAFVNPGDKVLLPNPGYPTYTAISRLMGAEIVYYDLCEENQWQPDFEQLERMDLNGVKLLWTNYPNMPTGGVARRETYDRLVAFARRNNIVVVNDNPYSLILNERLMSILQVAGAKDCCIELNSMSKSHNMPGWRVGMLSTNAEFLSWILKVKSNVDNGSFRPMQLAAATALENSDDWHRENNVENYRRRRRVAGEIMRALGCTYDDGQVGMFLWGRIPEGCENVEQLTERVLHEARVFITPGFIFGSNGRRYVRISLCCTEQRLAEALERIKRLK